jgi:hypothetical protein
VADQQGSGAVAVVGTEARQSEEGEAVAKFAVHGLKADLFPSLMEFMA